MSDLLERAKQMPNEPQYATTLDEVLALRSEVARLREQLASARKAFFAINSINNSPAGIPEINELCRPFLADDNGKPSVGAQTEGAVTVDSGAREPAPAIPPDAEHPVNYRKAFNRQP